MTFAADIFRDCSNGLSLSGGRAAARFSTELRRTAQCHQSVSRGSAWIGSLFAATPRLFAGLNYDSVLGRLLNAILSPQQRQSAHPVARRSPARPPLAPSPGYSRGAVDFQGGARTPAVPVSWPAAGPASRAQAARATSVSPSRRISPADLVRLAESSGSSGGAAATVTKKGRLPSVNSYAYRRESGTAAATVVVNPVLPGSLLSPAAAGSSSAADGLPTPAAIRDWQSNMVERVRGRLRSSFGGYGAVSGASHALQDLVVSGASPDLKDVWGLSIDGAAASPEILEPAAGLWAASATDTLLYAGSSSSAEPFVAPGAPVSPATTGTAGTESFAKVGRPAVLENVVASPEGAALAALQVMGEELLSKANDDLWVPSLLPSRRADGREAPFASSPASLARTEIAPLTQDMDLGEDLTALSLKMKRVLNEEARRHGIDV